MSPIRLVGASALATSGGVLLSEWMTGQRVLLESAGPHATWLRVVCVAIGVLGALAVRLSIQEEREFYKRIKEARTDEKQSRADRPSGPDATRGLCAVDHIQ